MVFFSANSTTIALVWIHLKLFFKNWRSFLLEVWRYLTSNHWSSADQLNMHLLSIALYPKSSRQIEYFNTGCHLWPASLVQGIRNYSWKEAQYSMPFGRISYTFEFYWQDWLRDGWVWFRRSVNWSICRRLSFAYAFWKGVRKSNERIHPYWFDLKQTYLLRK